MSEESRAPSAKSEQHRLESERKFRERGSFGVTADDHRAIGSTPPDELAANPGKTRADLMSDDEIAAWFARERADLGHFFTIRPDEGTYDFAQKQIRETEEKLVLDERYLRAIGRLR